MSQIDKLHYLPTFVWILILFLFWYAFIISILLPIYYKTLRTRYLYEKNLWLKIKEKEIILQLLEIFYSIWMSTILKMFRINNIIVNFKHSIFLKPIKNEVLNKENFIKLDVDSPQEVNIDSFIDNYCSLNDINKKSDDSITSDMSKKK